MASDDTLPDSGEELDDTKVSPADQLDLDEDDEGAEMTVFLDDEADADSDDPLTMNKDIEVTELVDDEEDLTLNIDDATDPDTPFFGDDATKPDTPVSKDSEAGAKGPPSPGGGGEEGDSDQMFVILPEQVDEEIPLADTQGMETAATVGLRQDLDRMGTEEQTGLNFSDDIDLTEPIVIEDDEMEADYAEDGVTERVEDDDLTGMGDSYGYDEDAEEPTEHVDDEDLDYMASDIDDDHVLMGQEGRGRSHGIEDFSELDHEDEEKISGGSRSLVRGFMSLAALGLLGTIAYYYLAPQHFLSTVSRISPEAANWIASITGKSNAGDLARNGDGATSAKGKGGSDAEVQVGGVDDTGDGSASLLTEEEKVQQGFRKKVLLALRLGFIGEDGYE